MDNWISVWCDNCGEEFQKSPAEYKRNVKMHRHHFCSKRCTGRYKVSIKNQNFMTYLASATNGCLIFQGYINKAGYGVIRYGGRPTLAHRVAWELMKHSIPKGIQVLHKCDNPPCVNLSHLFIGTHADNMRDMARKERQSSKITANPAHQIRQSHRLNKDLATEFGLMERQIRNIKSGFSWRTTRGTP